MSNGNKGAPAPILNWYGDKWNNQGTYDKDKRPGGFYFYQLPMPVMDYIFSVLDGKNGLMIKIMMVLIGTDKGYKISEKWICDRIGVDSSDRNKTRTYRKARENLCKMGWLEHDNEKHTLTICYDFIWQEVFAGEERQNVLSWKD